MTPPAETDHPGGNAGAEAVENHPTGGTTMSRPTSTAELFTQAAAALVRRDGNAFEKLIATNEDWLQSSDERDGNRKTLLAMQEAAYLLEGEPSEYSEDFGEDEPNEITCRDCGDHTDSKSSPDGECCPDCHDRQNTPA